MTGNYAHNTKAYNNTKDGGCYSDEFIEKHEPKTFPSILNANGYTTFYSGKYLNQYFTKEVPVGYDEFYGLHGNSKYYNYSLTANGRIETHGDDPVEDYYPNVIRKQAKEFISKQTKDKRFMAMISTPSCHEPFTPEDKYKDTLANLTVPRSKNFNVGAKAFEKHWMMTMKPHKLSDTTIDLVDEIYHRRLETLLTVDDMVSDIVEQLETQGLLDDTYIIFTSDNGFHLGNWAMPYDKRLPYETDTKVPLIIRGPNIPSKKVINFPVLLIDLAPTILKWANVSFNTSDFDGTAFSELIEAETFDVIERQMLIEHYGEGNLETWNSDCPWRKSQKLYGCQIESECKAQDSWNNTYSCVRHIASDINFIFCKFEGREEYYEAYDLMNDAYQLDNIAYDILPSIQARYQVIIENLKECKGDDCRVIKHV